MPRRLRLPLLLALLTASHAPAATLSVETPMAPPTWALLQRALLRANAGAEVQLLPGG